MTLETQNKIYKGSILGLALCIPSPVYQVTLGILAIVFFCWLKSKDYKFIPKQATQSNIWSPILLYVIVIIGFFFSFDRGEALSSLSTRLPYLLFPIIISTSSVIDNTLLKKAGNLFILSTCLTMLIAILFAFFDVQKTGIHDIQVSDSIYNKYESFGLVRIFDNWHPTNGSTFVNLSIGILGLHYIYSTKSLLRNSFTILIFLFLVVCIILLKSIMGVITLFFLLAFIGIIFLKKRKFSYRRILTSILLILICGILFFLKNPLHIDKIDSLRTAKNFIPTDKEEKRNLLTIRLAKWDTYCQIIKNNWLFGVTDGDIKLISVKAYLAKDYLYLAQHRYNAHNQYLEIWATYGLFGMILFLIMMFAPLGNYSNNYYQLFFLISFATFCSESLLNRQQGILFFMFFYSLFSNPFWKVESKPSSLT